MDSLTHPLTPKTRYCLKETDLLKRRQEKYPNGGKVILQIIEKKDKNNEWNILEMTFHSIEMSWVEVAKDQNENSIITTWNI